MDISICENNLAIVKKAVRNYFVSAKIDVELEEGQGFTMKLSKEAVMCLLLDMTHKPRR
jgi:hypothetical protein